ncbi:hypothetical protein FHS20_004243 [Phyllobacterium endophyticum]|uniref:Uncharacterized protein n=1 Tax=Phyllobacterium endophyticum TaxID=1149773 RepID=A0A2P7ARC5_9HYPH|nr:hypothetical protein [Phyllobacterium endophyticum]PSH56703.1 hypothetical protein CU100_15230 [Phyllobacterium endophyticum]
MPNREEKIASYKTLLDLHHRNIEASQRRLFELRTVLRASDGDEIAFNKLIIEDEMWEVHKLAVLIKRLEQSQRNDAALFRRMVRLGGSFWLNRKFSN